MPASRDFAISLSEEFVLHEQQINEGLSLAVYSFADARINAGGFWLDGAEHTLTEAVKALDLFSRLFGDYERERFVIVQGDFPDGMEFSGLVFVGSAWFYQFDGSPRNYLTLISVHEIAHQWWYAKVGNDAALNPWLDEAPGDIQRVSFYRSRISGRPELVVELSRSRLFPAGQGG